MAVNKIQFLGAWCICLMLSYSASTSASIVYDNGAPKLGRGANGLGFSNPSVADDFMLSTDTVVNEVTFWAYSNNGTNLAQIGWGIALDNGLDKPGSYLSTGLATSQSVIDTGSNINFSLDIYEVVFNFSDVLLSANTKYWLALDSGPLGLNAASGASGWLFTDSLLNGASAVYGGPTNWNRSHFYNLDTAFLLSSITSVPVPAALWLFGSGLLGLIGAARCSSTKPDSM